MELSILNHLKKVIDYNNKSYSFVIYVTAWEKLCIAYSNQSDPCNDKIFSTVVDPESSYISISLSPEEVSTVTTIDDAIFHIAECIDTLENDIKDDFEMPKYENLDLNIREEENHQIYCEVPEGMIPKVI